MCGIAGFCLSPSERCDSSKLARRLLLGIEERGRDATGCAWRTYDKPREIVVRKYPISASDWMQRRASEIAVNASSVILHTRYATKGSPSVALNNHPVCAGKLALVHNGHVFNDDDIFKRLNVRRRGQVDSEAIVALLAYGNSAPAHLLQELRGGASVAWLDATDGSNTLHMARVNTSPLHVAQTIKGSVVFASTKHAVDKALAKCGMVASFHWDVPEGTYLKVRDGRIVEEQSWNVRPAYTRSLWSDDEFQYLSASQGTHY